MEKIELTEESIKKYLDERITFWRTNYNAQSDEDILIKSCYVDAFQSVRTSLFNELKPKEANEPKQKSSK